MKDVKRPELLAPAGSLEKLKVAVTYGADAVYLAGKKFGLRAGAENFSQKDLQEGVSFAHRKGVLVYVAVNIFAHNRDLEGLEEYLEMLSSLPVDGIIVSDPGVLHTARKITSVPIHLSTQANTTNWASAAFWQAQGLKRLVLARELTLEEIKMIRKRVELELEVFVHGAMCISYSGRCLLSNFLTGRDANRGECAHPCRWKYSLVEEKRPGEYLPIEEDERGTYILNSRDLCMLEHLPELMAAGVNSFKIEGRMRSVHYVATVVGAYKRALDNYWEDPEGYVLDNYLREELEKVSHRKYFTGFFFGKPGPEGQVYESSGYRETRKFIGLVRGYDREQGKAIVEQRSPFSVGEKIEILSPGRSPFEVRVEHMEDSEGNILKVASHPCQLVKIPLKVPVKPYSMLRKNISE